MLDDNLAAPFAKKLLGVSDSMDSVENIRGRENVAICRAGRVKQAISLADLLLPSPAPEGAESVAAYRLWASMH